MLPLLLLALVVLDGLVLLLALALGDPRRPGIARPWRSCTVPVEARSPAEAAPGRLGPARLPGGRPGGGAPRRPRPGGPFKAHGRPPGPAPALWRLSG